jgi:glycosyltransferase involved in cell wall biosynthesis
MEKKLRIGFVSIEDAESVRSWSGTPSSILRVLRNRSDVEVVLISPLDKQVKPFYIPHKLISRLTKIPFYMDRTEGALRYYAAKISSVFRKARLDVIFSMKSLAVTRVRPGIPLVFYSDTVFHLEDGYYQTFTTKRWKQAGREQEVTALQKTTFACYASEWAASAARQFIPPDRVAVVPCGANLSIEHTEEDVQRWIKERCAARKQSCRLLWVGVNWQRKGGAIAVETARKLNEAGIATTLQIVGCTPPEPMPPFVELLGYISKHSPEGYRKLVELYRAADIFILPSRAEMFGIVVGEAAAFGLPALVCETGGLPETIREGVTGYALPLSDDGTQFAEKAQAILANYESFAANAYAEYKNRLNWEVSVDQIVTLLKKAASQNPR